MFDRKIFASRIKELRNSRGISQEELGTIMKVSKQAISEIEREHKTTTIEKLVELANYFDVSADYLLGRTDDPAFKKRKED